jgi:Predicted membrane protein
MIQNYLTIAFSSAAVYVFIITAIRLFGKKEFAQLSVSDLVFVLLISNAVQNAMVGPDATLSGGLVAASTLFMLNYLLKYLMYKFPSLQKMISGEPLFLIYHGRVNEENLKKAQISVNELIETVREHGCQSIRDVDLAVLEADGNISVLSHDFNKRTSHERKRRKKLTIKN